MEDNTDMTCSTREGSEYIALAGKPERTWPAGRFMRRWEDDIIVDLKEIKWEWVEQGSVAGSYEHG
jgi:hypothetical protein